MSGRGAAAATDGAAAAAAAVPPPSLSQLAHAPLKFLPSLLPACDNAAASSSSSSSGAASLRDSHAEAAQQRLVWSALDADASLLLRLPLSSFLSHALFNKSLHRFVENFLAQIATVWEQATGEPYTRSYWRTHSDADDGDDEEDEEKSAAVQTRTTAAAASSEQQAVLRSLARRVLLIYVRLCSTTLLPVDANGNAVVPAAPTADTPPLWLTSLFFTTSFSASPLFSPALLFDLCAFYSSVGRDAHRPLLALVLGRAADRLPYAFGQGMTAAVGALVQALHTQIRIIHAPFLAGTGGKKARFTCDEVQALVRNLAGLLWPLYSLCRIRTDVLRLLLQGVGAVPAAKSKANGSAPPPPFLALLSCLYSVTPLLLLNELGVKPAHLSSQPAIVHLRKGCLKFIDLIMRKALFKPMGVRVERARNGSVGRGVTWSAPRAADPKAPAPVSAAAATVSSTLPPSLTMVTACDTFFHALQLLHSAVNDDTKTEGLCALPTPMRNLVKANTPASLNACIRRANELFEFDAVLALLLQQAQQKISGSPGVLMGESRVVQLLKLLQVVDAPLLRERIHWPPPAAASSSSSSSKGMLDDEEQKGPAPLSVSLSRGASKAGGGDQSLAITELHDLFPSLYSSDYLSACLSEFNNDVEATTKALLEQSLPAYLQQIRDKARYRAGDHQLDSKLRRPDFDLFSRQSSSGFSSGSGLLDIAVDDEDEEAARHTLDVDDGAAFEMFLRRTGRVSKQQLEEKQRAQSGLGLDSGSGGSGGGGVLNAFGKGEAALLASKIQSSLNRFDVEEDEYDDAFDDFENFAVDGNDATELEERAAAFDRRGGGAQDADEPDGSYQRNYNSRTSQQQQQRHAPQSQQNNRDRPSIRGGRGGAAAAGGGGRSGAGRSGDDHVSVPASFMPEMTAGSSSGAAPDVREQWRRDAHRKELFVATVKAQKAQALAPSRRTREQEEDYQHGLRQGLIENLERPQTGRQQPQQQNKNQQQQPQQQQSRNNQQPQQQQQQQQQRPQSAQHVGGGGGGDSHRGDGSSRGGFSMRGGRGGGRGGGALSASASSFTPGGSSGAAPAQQAGGGAARPQSAAAPAPAPQHQQQHQQQQHPAHSHAAPAGGSVPSRWDEASDGDDGSGDDGDSNQQQQQQGGGGGGRGGRQSGQPMDLRQKKRKEKNKGIIGNHNRKAGAARKQGVQF